MAGSAATTHLFDRLFDTSGSVGFFRDHRAEFEDAWLQSRRLVHEHDDPGGAATALRAYFAGDLPALDRLTVDPMGTPFQIRVGMTISRMPSFSFASAFSDCTAMGKGMVREKAP